MDKGLKFAFVKFSLAENELFTIQNPIKGQSYLTLWKLEEEVKPVKSVVIHSEPISSLCLSKEGMYLGMGSYDGKVKIVDTRYFKVINEKLGHEMPAKGTFFTEDSRFLLSGSFDSSYNFLTNVRGEGLFSKLLKLFFVLLFLAYFFLLGLKFWSKGEGKETEL